MLEQIDLPYYYVFDVLVQDIRDGDICKSAGLSFHTLPDVSTLLDASYLV